MTEPIDVSIPADGIALAGHLRLPADGSGPRPALVLTGPFTGVKEQVTGTYAARLSEAGYVTLAFDHRGFGASGGDPRGHEDAPGKLADLSAATSFLAGRADVDADRIGCVGICLGGGYALKHAAFDRRIRALGLVAGAYNDPRAMRAGMGDQAYRATMLDLALAAQRRHLDGTLEYIKAVSDVEGEPAGMPGAEPFAYYGTARGGAAGWRNEITRLSLRELLTFDAAIGADFLGPTPAIVVHGRTDAYCSPEQAAAIHERLAGPKRMLWLDTTNHIDLYDRPAYVGPAASALSVWFDEHL
jgi:fermentation-respiration switch protein FrsA (DUF1100 family)